MDGLITIISDFGGKKEEYIDGLMTQLAYFEEFHGILFMLKPNNASTGFEHTILELIRYFHKEIAHNIAFVSTNTRSSLFQPGNTLPNLKKLCKDKKVYIDVLPTNAFWIDEIESLINHLETLNPNQVNHTTLLNDARRIILKLEKRKQDFVELEPILEESFQKTIPEDTKKPTEAELQGARKFMEGIMETFNEKIKTFDLYTSEFAYFLTTFAIHPSNEDFDEPEFEKFPEMIKEAEEYLDRPDSNSQYFLYDVFAKILQQVATAAVADM